MTFLIAGLIATWVCGLLFFLAQYLNDCRLVLNNFHPNTRSSAAPRQRPSWFRDAAGALPFSASFQGLGFSTAMLLIGRFCNPDRFAADRISSINPEALTEAGRIHLKSAIRRERIVFGWMIAGVILLIAVTLNFFGRPDY